MEIARCWGIVHQATTDNSLVSGISTSTQCFYYARQDSMPAKIACPPRMPSTDLVYRGPSTIVAPLQQKSLICNISIPFAETSLFTTSRSIQPALSKRHIFFLNHTGSYHQPPPPPKKKTKTNQANPQPHNHQPLARTPTPTKRRRHPSRNSSLPTRAQAPSAAAAAAAAVPNVAPDAQAR